MSFKPFIEWYGTSYESTSDFTIYVDDKPLPPPTLFGKSYITMRGDRKEGDMFGWMVDEHFLSVVYYPDTYLAEIFYFNSETGENLETYMDKEVPHDIPIEMTRKLRLFL